MQIRWYSQRYDDGDGEEEDDNDPGNQTLTCLHSNENTGAGGAEVEHVPGGAGLDGVEGTVTLASVRVPGLTTWYTLRPSLTVVTNTSEINFAGKYQLCTLITLLCEFQTACTVHSR